VILGPVLHGAGIVQSAPRVYVDFWGWTSDPLGEQDYLKRFVSSIGETPWLATVDQYGVRSMRANLLAGTWSDPASAPNGPTQSQVANEAFAAARHFGVDTVADPGNVQIIVATPPGHSPPDSWTYCTYHHGTTRGSNGDPYVSYTYLPYLPDIPGSCGDQQVNPGAAGHLDGVGIFVGRALAEAITDPQGTGWKDTFVQGNDHAIWHTWYDSAGWHPWESLGTIIISGPAAVSPAPNRINLFGMGTDYRIWHKSWNGVTWSSWQPVGAPPPGITSSTAPAVSSWGANQLDLFFQGDDWATYHTAWDNTAWSPWQRVATNGPAIVSSPAAVSWSPGRIDLGGIDTNGQVEHRSYQ
jgi:hypothetical protein